MDGMLRFDGSVRHEPAIDLWLAERGELGAIAGRWFARMRACGDEVRELIHDGCPVALIEDVPFGYVNVFRAHVNVGFYFGADLPDPGGLLVGDGKRMRHVKTRPGDEPDAEALGGLIDAAFLDLRSRLGRE